MRFPINLFSYSTGRWSRIPGGTDRCPYCHYTIASVGILYHFISEPATKATKLSNSAKKSIWLRHKYEGKKKICINFLKLLSTTLSNTHACTRTFISFRVLLLTNRFKAIILSNKELMYEISIRLIV